MLTHNPSFWVRFIFLLPFLANTLMPVGMMPAVSGDGTITLVICTAHGPQERTFPASDEEPKGTSSWCPLSLIGTPVLPSAPAPAPFARRHESVDLIVFKLDAPAHVDFGAFRPRGPPITL